MSCFRLELVFDHYISVQLNTELQFVRGPQEKINPDTTTEIDSIDLLVPITKRDAEEQQAIKDAQDALNVLEDLQTTGMLQLRQLHSSKCDNLFSTLR